MKNKELLVLFIVLIGVILLYLPGLSDGPYTMDDLALLDIPVFQYPFDFQTLRTIFTPGWHLDFYPIRDLSYAIDVYLFGASTKMVVGTVFRLHNFILLFACGFLILKILNYFSNNRNLNLVLAALWMVHPIHAETLMWISARKDILALFFFLLSCHFLIRSRNALSLIAFIASLLAKSTFSLAPLVAATLLLTRRERFQSSRFVTIALASAIGLANSCFQSWFYTNVHDMRMNYEWPYRIGASLAALGRSSFGLLIPYVNAIDTDNWGTWLSLNQIFIPAGLLIFALAAWLLKKYLKSANQVGLYLLFLALLLYIPVSGLIFPHRQFYSVRYFEPLFVIGIFLLGISHVSKKIIYICGMGVLALGIIDSKSWHSSLDAEAKGLNLTSTSLSLQSVHLAGLFNNRGHLSKQEVTDAQKIQENLQRHCDGEFPPDRNGHSCINYWIQFGGSYAVRNLLSFSRINSMDSFNRRTTVQKLLSLAPLDEKTLLLPSLQNTEQKRLILWRYKCYKNLSDGKRYLKENLEQKKIDDENVQKFISERSTEADHLNECRKP